MGAYDFGWYRYKWPRMGAAYVKGDTSRDAIRVNRAVRSIQLRLIELGYNPQRDDGVFGYGTKKAMHRYQKDENAKAGTVVLVVDDMASATDLRYLWRGMIEDVCHNVGVPKTYVAGTVQHESGSDPAATHLNDETTANPGSTDRGLVQINDEAHSEVTDQKAFSAHFSVVWRARVLKAKHDEYVADGADDQRAWDAAIMYNLDPSHANAYAAGDDSAPSDKDFKFVEDVKTMGRNYYLP